MHFKNINFLRILTSVVCACARVLEKFFLCPEATSFRPVERRFLLNALKLKLSHFLGNTFAANLRNS